MAPFFSKEGAIVIGVLFWLGVHSHTATIDRSVFPTKNAGRTDLPADGRLCGQQGAELRVDLRAAQSVFGDGGTEAAGTAAHTAGWAGGSAGMIGVGTTGGAGGRGGTFGIGGLFGQSGTVGANGEAGSTPDD